MEKGFRIASSVCDGESGCLVADAVPVFSWRAEAEGRGLKQLAFRVIVSGSAAACGQETGDVWDSGRMESDAIKVVFGGRIHAPGSQVHTPGNKTQYLNIQFLIPGIRYWWKLWLWDDAGNVAGNTVDFFQIALRPEDWRAKWITANRVFQSTQLIRCDFELPCDAQEAVANICGLGYNELYVNGHKSGDSVLDPAWTDYRKRVLYTAHDVAGFLRKGKNTVGVMLGSGWFSRMMMGSDSSSQLPLIFQMSVKLADGSTMEVISQRDGWTSNPGPITMAGIYYGEDYDARLEIPGWNEPEDGTAAGSDEKTPGNTSRTENWLPVLTAESPGGRLLPQKMEPIRPVGILHPVSSWPLPDGSKVYDMGQNFAGWARMTVSGPSGSSIRLRFAEMVNPDGTLNTINLRSARAEDCYILKGVGLETYQPRFTYHGFRYVQAVLKGCMLVDESLEGIVVRSAVEPTGTFHCSDKLLNAIQKACQWTEGSNLYSLPTDCPQRDERLFWLNDMTVRCEEAMYNFGVSALFANAVANIADTQGAVNGAIADTAPLTVYGRQPADPVSTSFLLIPWNLYRFYGSEQPMTVFYENLKRWQGYLEQNSDDDIVAYTSYGDWAGPVATLQDEGHSPASAITPGEFMSTGYYLYNARLLADMASILGKREEQAKFLEMEARIAKAFHQKYYHRKEATYATGSQACQTFALYLGLVEEGEKKRVLENLVLDVEGKGIHLTTGNLCSRYILDVLSANGRIDLAFALAAQTTYPSWGYMIENGATTIWERWEHVTEGHLAGMASYNHPMYASVSSWYYTTLAGIRPLFSHPGFARFEIAPVIPEKLESAGAKLKTVRGTICVEWRKKEMTLELNASVPFNSEAVLTVPVDCTRISESDMLIWENGRFVGSRGIALAKIQGQRLKLLLGSGEYAFCFIK